ncbi:low specificity L-threonine aldolase [Aliishimia ponticola]|uniref:Low specificity L-threonine aldolase n=1 Tax=Aliishimia ponticola TaxID=2499833 RepID=A0A4S4NEL5_9RHOB|nr:beta-eliminating lyase-related protein [Aliishimia ponticola]THH36997.1 low specificity L-threonine aldolase [Aliishimia ponticola]
MFLASDNSGPAHPQVMAALAAANEGHAMPYGADPIMAEVKARLRDLFEAPEAEVLLVATGTAANVLALAPYAAPWQTVFCSPVAHIHEDECNAPEFYTGGAKLTLVPGGDKMSASALAETIAGEETRGVHGPQRGPVSITQVTERGGVYSLEHLGLLCGVAKEAGLPVHLDGARFANAMVALGCTPAEMTWKAGVDVVSFGATKNGAMGVEAVVFFDPDKAWECELRRKRGGHLFSKHRYLAAQMLGYLANDVWLDSARAANAQAAKLAEGLKARGAEFLSPVEANIIFATLPRAAHQRLHEAGAQYYLLSGSLEDGDADEMLPARMVCDWSLSDEAVEEFLSYI